jgi:hypothetical protein
MTRVLLPREPIRSKALNQDHRSARLEPPVDLHFPTTRCDLLAFAMAKRRRTNLRASCGHPPPHPQPSRGLSHVWHPSTTLVPRRLPSTSTTFTQPFSTSRRARDLPRGRAPPNPQTLSLRPGTSPLRPLRPSTSTTFAQPLRHRVPFSSPPTSTTFAQHLRSLGRILKADLHIPQPATAR